MKKAGYHPKEIRHIAKAAINAADYRGASVKGCCKPDLYGGRAIIAHALHQEKYIQIDDILYEVARILVLPELSPKQQEGIWEACSDICFIQEYSHKETMECVGV